MPPFSFTPAQSEFFAQFPAYASTAALDDLRAREFTRLTRAGHIYLDYTGGGLYPESLVREHAALLLENTFGNPHSSNPTSIAMTHLVESARHSVLRYFNASADEYVVIFTQNASGALKLVGESYPFAPGGEFLLTFDNHNSVNGIREFARTRGARVTYAPVLPPDLRIDEARLRELLASPASPAARLFAFPGQSNFSGVKHSLEWVAFAQAHGWDVLLDAAAFAPTNRLDLAQVQPQFVSLSFYKMFGYPTGVGALLARRAVLEKLHRPWFAGGTVEVASVQGDKYYLHGGAEGFEDGTLNYLTLPAVENGLAFLQTVGIEQIARRVACLTEWLLQQFATLTHSNGRALVRLYGPLANTARGGTLTFNLYDCDGHFVDHRLVEQLANRAGISLRTGCFCNPGGGELALGISAEELTSCFLHSSERLTLDEFRRCIDDKSTGAVRVSLGLVSNFADVFALVQFLGTFLEQTHAGLNARWQKLLTDEG